MKKIMLIAAHPDDEFKTLILGQRMLSRGEDESILTQLRADSKKANDIIGVNELKFFNFSDNAFYSIDLLKIMKFHIHLQKHFR